ncbi:uncharacterized protein [Pyrus communis]|uniref:uncharacterized protein n=1 Tax=Pyrus communis TaxID=23211 RepID=UPI0035C1BAFC
MTGMHDSCQHFPETRGNTVSKVCHVGWRKPPFGTFKVNCEGAWCSSTGVGGFGWMVRDFAGIFQGAGGVGNVRCVSSVMGEAEAPRAALVACVERGFGVVQVETDSKVLVDMINGILQLEAVIDGIL